MSDNAASTEVTPESSLIPLELALGNRRWIESRHPFPHVRATDVFNDKLYEELADAFLSLLKTESTSNQRGSTFAKTITTYDAYIGRIPRSQNNPLRIFLSRPWHDMLAKLFKVPATGDVNVELHHHQIGSLNGRVHNDLNPGWFTGEAEAGMTNEPGRGRGSYKFGPPAVAEESAHQRVRAVAMIFYLANPVWKAGDGGETGLYRTSSDGVEAPIVAVAPRNNSFVAFECSPFSFHSFLSNSRTERNAVVLWLHRPYREAVSCWGEKAIVHWPKGAKPK